MAASGTQFEKEGLTGRSDTPRSDQLKDNLVDAGSSLRQAAASAIPAAQEQLQRVTENMAERTESFETYLTECIQEKPLSAVLVAAGIGVLAGAFLLRR
jgi:ElaB/YqjD/DUF883 family membrane-anchored ribosome-binding protein